MKKIKLLMLVIFILLVSIFFVANNKSETINTTQSAVSVQEQDDYYDKKETQQHMLSKLNDDERLSKSIYTSIFDNELFPSAIGDNINGEVSHNAYTCLNSITFTPFIIPNPECCFNMNINVDASSPVNAVYIDIPHIPNYNNYYSLPNEPLGWTMTLSPKDLNTDRYLWTLNSGTFIGQITLGTTCLFNTVSNGQQVLYAFSNTGGTSWFCLGSYSLPVCVPPPSPCNFNLVPGAITCNPLLQSGPSYTYDFWLTIYGNISVQIASITPNLGTLTPLMPTSFPFNTSASGTSFHGKLVVPSFPTSGTVTFTVVFDWTIICQKTVTYTLPVCGLPLPCDNSATFTPWPLPNADCCFNITLNGNSSINAFYVDVPHSSTYGIPATPPAGWVYTFTQYSSLNTDRYLWAFSPGFSTGQVILGNICFYNSVLNGQNITYGFSNNNGVAWSCTGFYLPTCVTLTPCNISIQAIPPIICNNQGSTITSSGYTGIGSNIVWYMTTTNPGAINAPLSPWTLTTNAGISMNTGNLTCNPPNEVTKYWYMAILTDPNCTISPIFTNIVTVTVNPVFNLIVTGDKVLCSATPHGKGHPQELYGGSTTLTLDGLGTNTTCQVKWMDLQTNTQITPIVNTNNMQILLVGLTASLIDCPFKIYHYSVTICDGICNPMIPIDIKVYSNSKATQINASRDHICWGEDARIKFLDNNYCGDIQWQLNSQSGTGGLWVDIPGATGTNFWQTNRLIETTQYRVRFTNGVCPPVYSNEDTIFVQTQVSAIISYHTSLCPGVLCPNVQFDLNINPATSTWQWYKDGSPIAGTNQLMSYTTNVAGHYSVVVIDPVCGNVTSNVVSAVKFGALLSGPTCVCFNPYLDTNLTVTPVCDACGPFHVVLFKNNGIIVYTGIRTPDSDGNIVLQNIHLNPGDRFWVKIKGKCGEATTNFYEPTGCDCPH